MVIEKKDGYVKQLAPRKCHYIHVNVHNWLCSANGHYYTSDTKEIATEAYAALHEVRGIAERVANPITLPRHIMTTDNETAIIVKPTAIKCLLN